MQWNIRFLSPVFAAIITLTVAANADDAASEYSTVRQQWDQLNAQLDSLETEFRAASGEARDGIRARYAATVEEVNALLPHLRQAAETAYRENPGNDEKLTRLLVGMVAQDVRNDRYPQGLDLAELLMKNGAEFPALYEQAGVAAYSLDRFEQAEAWFKKAEEAGQLTPLGRNYLTDVDLAKKFWKKEQQIRQQEAKADDLPRVLLNTTKGDITIELFENEAPDTVGNFVSLVDKGFYDGLSFHRVLPGFMAQVGCPKGDGTGDPGYSIYCESYEDDHRNHFSGSLSMAKGREKNTGGSQFFLTFRRTSHLDGIHTVFGRIIDGYDVLAELQRVDPSSYRRQAEPDKIVEAKVLRKRDHPYEPNKVQ